MQVWLIGGLNVLRPGRLMFTAFRDFPSVALSCSFHNFPHLALVNRGPSSGSEPPSARTPASTQRMAATTPLSHAGNSQSIAGGASGSQIANRA
jgi:hypothetical protein